MNFPTRLPVLVIIIASLQSVVCLNNTNSSDFLLNEAFNVTEGDNVTSTPVTPEETTTVTPATKMKPIPRQRVTKSDDLQLEPWLTQCSDCACDRTSECDVGCCCDPHCFGDGRLVFDHCEDYVFNIHRRHCLRSDSFFRNTSHFKLVNTSDGLFCIVPEKASEAVTCHKQFEVLATAEQFDRVTVKNGDPIRSPVVNDKRKLLETEHGKPILVEVNGDYRILGFPASLAGVCTGLDPILYLTNYETSCCSQIDLASNCETNPRLNAANYYQHFSVISGQNKLPVTPCDCGKTDNCSRDVAPPVYDSSAFTCSNMVSQVHYVITHNGASGIQNITVFFSLQNHVDLTKSPQKWCQTFSVSYITSGYANTKSECQLSYPQPVVTKSGNPGYIIGAPVLAGKWNDTTGILLPFPLTHLTTAAAGDCNTVKAVPFGENVKTGCTVSTTELHSCSELQHVASKLFDIDVNRIGVFGNVSPSMINDWVPLLYRNLSKNSDVPSSHRRDVCKFVVDVHLTLAFARVGHKANPQAKIVGALLTKTEQDFPMFCTQLTCDFQQHFVHITFGVSFVDVSRT